jgi:hypothetical protein
MESYKFMDHRKNGGNSYRVIDDDGAEHGFKTATEANSVFANSFDEDCDLDE